MVRYKMIGKDINALPTQYRHWVVEGSPDLTASQYTGLKSGENPLVDIVAYEIQDDNAVIDFMVPDPLKWLPVLTTLPDLIYDSQLAIIDGYAYLFGGVKNANIYRADLNRPTRWIDTGFDLPGTLGGSSLAIIDGYLYLFGGEGGADNQVLDTIYKANIENPLEWIETESKLPNPIANSNLTIADGYIYLFGGRDLNSAKDNIWKSTVTDPLTWVMTDGYLPHPVYGSVVSVIGSKIYLFGGLLFSDRQTDKILSADISDPLTWVEDGYLPYPCSFGQFLRVGNDQFLYTSAEVDNDNKFQTRILRYNGEFADTNICIPGNISQSQFAIIDDVIFAFGGNGNTAIFYCNQSLKAIANNPYGLIKEQVQDACDVVSKSNLLGFPSWKTSYFPYGYDCAIPTPPTEPPGAVLNDLTWLLPRLADGIENPGFTWICPHFSEESVVMTGTPGTTYDVTLRIIGHVEAKTYVGGGPSDGNWKVGGTPIAENYNVYGIYIWDPALDPNTDNPSKTYYINNGASGNPIVFQIDMTKTIRIKAGSTIKLKADSIDEVEIWNTLSFPGVTYPEQPYLGQWAKVIFVDSEVSPPIPPPTLSYFQAWNNYNSAKVGPTNNNIGDHTAYDYYSYPILVAIAGLQDDDVSELYYVPTSGGGSTEVYNVGDADCFLSGDSIVFNLRNAPLSQTANVYVKSADGLRTSNVLQYIRWTPSIGSGSEVCTLFCDTVYPSGGYVETVGSTHGYWLSRPANDGVSVINALVDENLSAPVTAAPVYGNGVANPGIYSALSLAVYKKSGGILSGSDIPSSAPASLNDIFSTSEGTVSLALFHTNYFVNGVFFQGADQSLNTGCNLFIYYASGYIRAGLFKGGDENDSANYIYTSYAPLDQNGFYTIVVRFKDGQSIDMSVNGSSFFSNSTSVPSSFYTGNSYPGAHLYKGTAGSQVWAVATHSTYVSDDYADKFYKWDYTRSYNV